MSTLDASGFCFLCRHAQQSLHVKDAGHPILNCSNFCITVAAVTI